MNPAEPTSRRDVLKLASAAVVGTATGAVAQPAPERSLRVAHLTGYGTIDLYPDGSFAADYQPFDWQPRD